MHRATRELAGRAKLPLRRASTADCRSQGPRTAVERHGGAVGGRVWARCCDGHSKAFAAEQRSAGLYSKAAGDAKAAGLPAARVHRSHLQPAGHRFVFVESFDSTLGRSGQRLHAELRRRRREAICSPGLVLINAIHCLSANTRMPIEIWAPRAIENGNAATCAPASFIDSTATHEDRWRNAGGCI